MVLLATCWAGQEETGCPGQCWTAQLFVSCCQPALSLHCSSGGRLWWTIYSPVSTLPAAFGEIAATTSILLPHTLDENTMWEIPELYSLSFPVCKSSPNALGTSCTHEANVCLLLLRWRYDQEQLGGERVYFILQVPVHHSGMLRHEPEAEVTEEHCLFTGSCSTIFYL